MKSFKQALCSLQYENTYSYYLIHMETHDFNHITDAESSHGVEFVGVSWGENYEIG